MRRFNRLVVIASVLSVVALLTVSATAPRDVILFNPSPSIPPGHYVRAHETPHIGAVVTVRAADVAPGYAALRGFTDDGDRFIKHVAAVAGDEVCAESDRISINARTVARRAWQDSMARLLPQWEGCRVLRSGEVFLLGDTPDSFDSRYFGIVRVEQIEGVWRKL